MSNSKIRALVVTGRAEGIFSAGFDVTPTDKFISDMFQALANSDKVKLVDGFAYIQNIISKLSHLPFPTVAAINGLCYGGGVELAYFSPEGFSITGHRICKEHNSQQPFCLAGG
jgi:enoyl-CoA hydratase/carnithine racemase